MPSHSTTFKLRTPSHIETCHLIGSWDNYGKKMSMAQDTAAGPGFWKITLSFPSNGSTVRYWYYYVLDGYFESHDPNQPTCKEPTRGITLNILDCGASRESSPTSARSSHSSHSSRFPSPSSSVSSSSSSHRGYCRRAPSPPPCRPASHILQPVPRNPLTQHKLTLDTNCRPISVMTSAATTCGDSPVGSASSSRSNSSVGSYRSSGSSCSSCSTVFSEGSPTTPACNCSFSDNRRAGVCWASGEESCDEDSSCCCSSDDDDEYERRQRRQSRRASYHPSKASHGGQLAYELERRLKM